MRSFFYDGNRIIAEREGSSWVVRYLAALKPCGFVANGAIRIYHADRLGSVRFVTDANQNILVSYIYEGFGKVIAQNGGGGGPYQFCGLWGYRNDHDAGLLHVGARYYEPETGRFVQKDAMLGNLYEPLILNPYVYCLNNPISFVDPDGYEAAVAGTLTFAGGLVLADGPLPIGDIIAGGIVIVGLIVIGIEMLEARKTRKEIEKEPRYPREVERGHRRRKFEEREKAKKEGRKPKYPQPYNIRPKNIIR